LGRKRHIVVDVLGLLLIVMVHSAGIQDRNGAKHVLTRLISRFPGLKLVWADGGYAGKLVEWVATVLQRTLSIVKRPRKSQGFRVLQWRWIVERTFGWLNRSRRLSKDFEALPETTETWIRIAMIQLMTKRLAAKTRLFRQALRWQQGGSWKPLTAKSAKRLETIPVGAPVMPVGDGGLGGLIADSDAFQLRQWQP